MFRQTDEEANASHIIASRLNYAERLSSHGVVGEDVGGQVVEDPDPIPFAPALTLPPSAIVDDPHERSQSDSKDEVRPPPLAIWPNWTSSSIALFFLVVLAVGVTVLLVVNGREQTGEQVIPTTMPSPSPRVMDISNFTVLYPIDLKFGDWFGCSVAIHNDVLVVGTPRKRVNNTETGAVYVFRRSKDGQWTEEQLLFPGQLAKSRFGRSVAVHESRIIAGANFDDNYTGSAFVFVYENGTWKEEQKLVALDATENSLFGITVAIHDNMAFVGAKNEHNGTGSVYIFARNVTGIWTQAIKLEPKPDPRVLIPPPFAAFGSSLAVNEGGETLVVGSKQGGDNGGECVSVYVAAKDGTWAELDKLLIPDDEFGDDSGRSVAIHGDTIAVGVAGKDRNNIIDAGGVFSFLTYDFEIWDLKQTMWFEETRPKPASRFGHGVVLNSNYLVITSRYGGQGRTSTAHVYMKVGNDWKWKYNLVVDCDLRRATVAIATDNTIVLGSTYGNSLVGNRTGAVFMFHLPTEEPS